MHSCDVLETRATPGACVQNMYEGGSGGQGGRSPDPHFYCVGVHRVSVQPRGEEQQGCCGAVADSAQVSLPFPEGAGVRFVGCGLVCAEKIPYKVWRLGLSPVSLE